MGWMVAVAWADDVVVLEGALPDDALDHVFVPFDVPAGVQEIEVHLDDQSEANILDWGVDDPNGHRGWGGGNEEPAVIGLTAASRSYVPGPLPAGRWSVVVGKARIREMPATYRITVTTRDAPTLAPQDRRPYQHAPALEVGPRWYVGDMHVHSDESGDASASIDEVADAARAAGLDFVVLTEHNVVTGADFLVAAQARHPDVLLIPGVEVTTYQGHAGAIGATTWIDHRLGQPRGDGVVDVQSLADDVTSQGAALSIHHPTLDLGDLCIGCAWALDLPVGVGGVEIGNSGWEPIGSLFTPASIAAWDAWCATGLRLAAFGGSDDHRAGEGTGPFDRPVGTSSTAIFAEELSVPALLAGIAEQRTQVLLEGPSSPRVAIALDGDKVVAEVTGAADALVWVADGVEVERVALPVEGAIARDVAGVGRVRAELWVDDHPVTVTSHVWPADATAAGDDDADVERGCGCGSSPVGGSAAPALLLALWCRRRSLCVSIPARRPSHGPKPGP